MSAVYGIQWRRVGAPCVLAAGLWVSSTAVFAQSTAAQNFPVKPVRYVVPFAAGTGNDIVGRLIGDRLTRMWGQQVIVDNRDRKSTRLNSSHIPLSRMPSSA